MLFLNPRIAFIGSLLLVSALSTSPAYSEETVVTTYITKRQEERESTRFTLTEWLRIRERMKMMDVWLAMFSDPQKDVFAPELGGFFLMQQAKVKIMTPGKTEEGSYTAKEAGGQIYLTNLFTYSTKLRTLNIDLGLEGNIRQTSAFSPSEGSVPPGSRKETLKYFLGNLRIFGKNVQDSSLVIKYGQYFLGSSLTSLTADAVDQNTSGQAAGAELQLYLFRWLGLEGQAIKFGDSTSAFASGERQGLKFLYGPYIEIAVLRLVGGWYKETWSFSKNNIETKTADEGLYAGMRLLL